MILLLAIFPSKIKALKVLITLVKELRLTAISNPPVKESAGNKAVLRKNTGRTIAFITVS